MENKKTISEIAKISDRSKQEPQEVACTKEGD